MNLLFIAIPKCAGTSTVDFLQKKLGMGMYLSIYTDKISSRHISNFKNVGHSCFSHANPNVLIDKGIINKDYYNKAFKFCFVRNPWERAVSLFFFQELNKEWQFKDFIKYIYDHPEVVPPINEYHYQQFLTLDIKRVPFTKFPKFPDIAKIKNVINFLKNQECL